MERCFDTLPPESRNLVSRYYGVGEDDRARARRELAGALGLPVNALRLRVHRVRLHLEACLRSCLAAGEPSPRRGRNGGEP